ncbi:unnamed protein product [Blepharisma stoltei]|uniref:Uncharacterized protein n=1 Tax=Blepharisma stoltei TaxID=1481888 RepID=A0AAU9IL85_9CILI|nr:unnamed protein product [Blepharisma stoltei]
MDFSESAKGVSAIVQRSQSSPANTIYSRITDIQFDFKRKNKVGVHIEITQSSSIDFEVDYSLLDFNDTFKRCLLEAHLNTLDVQSIDNLFQVKLVDHLLVQTIKKSMQKINNMNSQAIYLKVKEDQENPDKVVKDCIKNATAVSNQILQYINSKHQRINEVMKKFTMEVYERGPLIARSIEELTDNLNRKFILTVNQIIELQRGHTITESHLSEQVKSLINNL